MQCQWVYSSNNKDFISDYIFKGTFFKITVLINSKLLNCTQAKHFKNYFIAQCEIRKVFYTLYLKSKLKYIQFPLLYATFQYMKAKWTKST